MTDEQQAIIEALSVGIEQEVAANAAGVTLVQFFSWLRQGQTGTEHAKFRAVALEARVSGEHKRQAMEEMRRRLQKYDELVEVMHARAAHYKAMQRDRAGGDQMGLYGR